MNIKPVIILMIFLISLTITPGLGNEVFSHTSIQNMDNTPPEPPIQPSGPVYGEVGEQHYFFTNTTDAEGDNITYGWDFTGDHVVDKWTDLVPSNQSYHCDWIWWTAGTYNISVKAEDEFGAQSDFSENLQILINTPPRAPISPAGPTKISPDVNYTFSTISTDPDEDKIWYRWYWDSISDWMGPYESGETVKVNLMFQSYGNIDVRVQCKDIHNSTSPISEPLTVQIVDLVDVNIPVLQIGKIRAQIKNNVGTSLKNVSWNISITRNRIIRDINVLENNTIDEFISYDLETISTEPKLVLKIGIIKIKVDIFIPELDGEPYEKTVMAYGFIFGRIILVSPIYKFLLFIYNILRNIFPNSYY